jgi:iron complex transport system substrate-binding protein
MEKRVSGGNGQPRILSFEHAPRRVVSLVPSVTESLFDLGAGQALVGVTEYCQPPDGDVARLTRVGGTKSANVAAIRDLEPDLVIANQEENTREVVETLEEAGLDVWVTFPRSVEGALQVLWALVRLFRLTEAAAKVQTLELTVSWTAGAVDDPVDTFVPIWRQDSGDRDEWWMTISETTYVHDLLRVCGARNIFGDRERRYPLAADLGRGTAEDPGDRDIRYPRVTAEEIREGQPRLILVPSEPYAFSEEEAGRLSRIVPQAAVRTVDGRLLTWHGTRMGRALAELPSLIQQAIQA